MQEMVHKFLTREHTYASLLVAVNENERKLEDLKNENDNKYHLLNNLQLNYENMKKQGGEQVKDESEEIIGLKEDIAMQNKDLHIMHQRKKNIHLVVDLV